jgi:methionyl-tRNA formyltransferase
MTNSPQLRVVFAGTPDFAIPSLKALIADQLVDVVAVYSQPDRRAGRGRQLMATPIKQCALDAGIKVETPINFKEADTRETLAQFKPDLMVVAAYGLLLPQSVLDIPKYGCINVHASLLPRWRGAAPVQAAILAGDTHTGVGIMRMEKGLDTGGVYVEKRVAISDVIDAGKLTIELANIGAETLNGAIQQEAYKQQPTPQAAEGVTYAHKIQKADAKINWAQPAAIIQRHIRAYWPWPGAFTFYGDKRLKVSCSYVTDQTCKETPGTILGFCDDGLLVATNDFILCVEQCQPEGKTMKAAQDWSALLNTTTMLT